MTITGNVEKDIFETTYIMTDQQKNKMIEKINDCVRDFSEMRNLYNLLKSYYELCGDLGNCKHEYTKGVIKQQLEILERGIHRFYVVNIFDL